MNTLAKKSLIFENDRKLKEYKLTYDGSIRFTGSEDHCYMTLQKSQGRSADYAIKHGGWKIEPTGNEINDPRITVKVLNDVSVVSSVICFEYRGKEYLIHKNAAYGYGTFHKGQTLDVDSAFAYLPDSQNEKK